MPIGTPVAMPTPTATPTIEMCSSVFCPINGRLAAMKRSVSIRSPTPLPQRDGSQVLCVFAIFLAQPRVVAVGVMFRHVGREAACGRAPAERLGERADVVRAGAATDSEIAHVHG